jgi:uncharacterized OB-fold protein
MAQPTPKGVYPSPQRDPFANEYTQPFWDAALEGRLVAPRCTTCGYFVLPPQPFCFNDQNTKFEWVELPGTGTLYSFTVVRHALGPHLADVVPYVSGIVELDGTQGAGARMIANIVDCDPDTVAVGDRVQIAFDQVSDTYAVPRFRKV